MYMDCDIHQNGMRNRRTYAKIGLKCLSFFNYTKGAHSSLQVSVVVSPVSFSQGENESRSNLTSR